jgi:hypothetical protein
VLIAGIVIAAVTGLATAAIAVSAVVATIRIITKTRKEKPHE